MKAFVVYQRATGMIMRSGQCTETDYSKQVQSADEAVCDTNTWELIDDTRFWVVNGQIVERPQMPLDILTKEFAADGHDYTVIAQVPQGAQATVRMGAQLQSEVVEDGTLELCTTIPGTYVVMIAKFPYIDWVGEFNAY